MLALSIRQPWASLILKAGKDIENRCWSTKVRGRVLVHAAKGMTRDEHADAIDFAVDAIRADPKNAGAGKFVTLRDLGFSFGDLQRGGIVGSVEIVDCVRDSASPWFMGEFGFVLRDPQPLPFTPWKGQLGFFDVPETALKTGCKYPDCSCDGPGEDGGCGLSSNTEAKGPRSGPD